MSAKVGLYRFYNWEVSKSGEPFALCEAHAESQVVPGNCTLEKIADGALRHCENCEVPDTQEVLETVKP